MSHIEIIYLTIHGVTTVGSVIVFLVRNEHRITKMETRLDYLEKSHDTLTAKGTLPHGSDQRNQEI